MRVTPAPNTPRCLHQAASSVACEANPDADSEAQELSQRPWTDCRAVTPARTTPRCPHQSPSTVAVRPGLRLRSSFLPACTAGQAQADQEALRQLHALGVGDALHHVPPCLPHADGPHGPRCRLHRLGSIQHRLRAALLRRIGQDGGVERADHLDLTRGDEWYRRDGHGDVRLRGPDEDGAGCIPGSLTAPRHASSVMAIGAFHRVVITLQ